MSRSVFPPMPAPRITALAALLLLAATPLAAQPAYTAGTGQTARLSLRAVRLTTTPPLIDGRMDDEAWAAADVADGFVQVVPSAGAPATEPTEVRVLYDDGALYVGMRMYDGTPDGIAAPLGRRDQRRSDSDWAHLLIDSYLDRRTGFGFSVNPRGVQRDALYFDDTREQETWDAVWQAAARVDSAGWTAEFRIPHSQLRFKTGSATGTWGINFGREVARTGEVSVWSPIPPGFEKIVSVSGDLQGLRDLRPPRRLELTPYSVGRLTRETGEEGDPLHEANAWFGSLGADMKYGVTSDLTLTATLNPDFGQVEADPAEVNLTTFETFFPERRPFFTEGMELFQLGLAPELQLFYSRRIGRAPQRSVSIDDGYVDAPRATRVLGAAKLSGKTESGWSIGAFSALTAREDARTVDALGRPGEEPVEPLTSYSVLRVMRDFRRGDSSVGALLTSTQRQLDGEPLDFLASSALAGGLNARHRFPGGHWEVRGRLLGSRIAGSETALIRAQRSSVRYYQRPDATHLRVDSARTELAGWGGQAEVHKLTGDWIGTFFVGARSPGLELNDLGFQNWSDRYWVATRVSYRNFRPGRLFRRWSVGSFSLPGVWTFGDELATRHASLNGDVELHNRWGAQAQVGYDWSILEPTELRGGPAMRLPDRLNLMVGLNSDPARPFSIGLSGASTLHDEAAGSRSGVELTLGVRPSPRAQLSLAPSLSRNRPAAQYIRTARVDGDPRYLFGRLDQTTLALTTRVAYTFSPTLSFEAYAQPFLSTGEYSHFRRVDAPRAESFAERFHTFPDASVRYEAEEDRYAVDETGDGRPEFRFSNPDFDVRELRSTLLLRWEYRPGSTLFVVWSQDRGDDDVARDFRFRDELDRLFSAPARHVFLVKLSYWIGS